jgi:molybdopterin synthase sulfur carrier subunit
MATIKLFGNLRKHIAGSQLTILGESVRVILDTLCDDYPNLCNALLEGGEVRPHFIITLNGHDISLAEGLDTPVSEGDRIAIFPPIAGG